MITWVYNVQICLFCRENEGFLMKEKTVKKNKKNAQNNQADSLVKGRILSLVLIFTPVIISLFIMVIKWLVQGYVALPGPKWNDEAVYLKLIQSYSDYFSPRGYWGFDAKHAILGNGPAWSPAILLPYVIPAIVFPVGYSFVYICNIFYITIVNALFLLLTKPDLKRKIKLAVLEATSVVFVLYINTNMSELFRFALAILIAGLLYKMFFDECNPLFDTGLHVFCFLHTDLRFCAFVQKENVVENRRITVIDRHRIRGKLLPAPPYFEQLQHRQNRGAASQFKRRTCVPCD